MAHHIKNILNNSLLYFSTLALAGCSKISSNLGMHQDEHKHKVETASSACSSVQGHYKPDIITRLEGGQTITLQEIIDYCNSNELSVCDENELFFLWRKQAAPQEITLQTIIDYCNNNKLSLCVHNNLFFIWSEQAIPQEITLQEIIGCCKTNKLSDCAHNTLFYTWSKQATLQEIINYCKTNEIDEDTKCTIFSSISGQLESLKTAEDKKQQYRDILHFIYGKSIDVDKKWQGEADCGNTMLMSSIAMGRDGNQEFSLMLLRDFNANPFILDKYGKNALHFLLLKGHKVQQCVVDQVLAHSDARKHINNQTILGDTALHIACARKNRQNIKQLLKHGASLNITNNKGQTPIEMLDMNKAERRKFLTEEEYLGKKDIGRDYLDDVATIDEKMFSLDPGILKKEIKEFCKTEGLDTAIEKLSLADKEFCKTERC